MCRKTIVLRRTQLSKDDEVTISPLKNTNALADCLMV